MCVIASDMMILNQILIKSHITTDLTSDYPLDTYPLDFGFACFTCFDPQSYGDTVHLLYMSALASPGSI